MPDLKHFEKSVKLLNNTPAKSAYLGYVNLTAMRMPARLAPERLLVYPAVLVGHHIITHEQLAAARLTEVLIAVNFLQTLPAKLFAAHTANHLVAAAAFFNRVTARARLRLRVNPSIGHLIGFCIFSKLVKQLLAVARFQARPCLCVSIFVLQVDEIEPAAFSPVPWQLATIAKCVGAICAAR